jgi:hypothetical protein
VDLIYTSLDLTRSRIAKNANIGPLAGVKHVPLAIPVQHSNRATEASCSALTGLMRVSAASPWDRPQGNAGGLVLLPSQILANSCGYEAYR